jgi:hypothetical protein
MDCTREGSRKPETLIAQARERHLGVVMKCRLFSIAAAVAVAIVACGTAPSSSGEPASASSSGGSSGASGASGGASSGGSSGTGDGGGGGQDGGGSSGSGDAGPITCPSPGTYTKNGGPCGTERWDVKTGTDPGASGVRLVPTPTTIAALVALPAPSGATKRAGPVEETVWELTDVTLAMIKLETDSDYHMVLSDGAHTMIVEIPYPLCASASAWSCFISRARAEVDAKLTVTPSFQYPALTVTVRGVGFFDFPHGQAGVAPNAIELHPVLELCFGKGCSPS